MDKKDLIACDKLKIHFLENHKLSHLGILKWLHCGFLLSLVSTLTHKVPQNLSLSQDV